ncbi:30S ribosomal protein S6 [Thermocrinis minervae]|uniref:Small ribosomal subunit protein bS6 n=1 Tax=Thermocrinis minervae TaxID=381751 RepID=A0A1M6S873_9AQUI|nr:30S ribosomal protein S6 [Thermocrinis minervae]SHK40982.1 small subunit ribosomal protein S6 [Thermocrinis minervae]
MGRKFYKTLRYYESVFVLKPTLTEEEVQKVLKDVRDFIQKKGGVILTEEDWGLKQLAYRIQNFMHGRYFVFQIKTENPQLPNELDFFFKINDNIIRWLNFQVKEKEVKAIAQ